MTEAIYRNGYTRQRMIQSASALGALALTMLPSAVFSNTAPPVIAYVSNVGTYGSGAVFVYFDRPISSCGSTTRLYLHAAHAARKEVLSIAMTAFLTGAQVKVHPGGCSGVYPTFDTADDSYIYLTAEPAT